NAEGFDPNVMILPVVSDKSINIDLAENETLFSGFHDMLKNTLSVKDSGEIKWISKSETIPQKFIGSKKDFIVSYHFTAGGLPVAIVDETTFDRLKKDIKHEIQMEPSTYIGIDLKEETNINKANDLFQEMDFDRNSGNVSRLEMANNQKQVMGLIMFVVGFLGLSFLITSGCILYFKQMDEGEDEKGNYTILRKLGFTQVDLLKGIQAKQLLNFGIPLVIGLLHSYFAVKSGWFFFGTELWTPMIAVMIIYTILYSIFGILSVLYYKKLIREALY